MPRPIKYPFPTMKAGDVINIPCQESSARARVRSAAGNYGRKFGYAMYAKKRPDGSMDVWCMPLDKPKLHYKDKENMFTSMVEGSYREVPIKAKQKLLRKAEIRRLRDMVNHLRTIRGYNLTAQAIKDKFCVWRYPDQALYLAGLERAMAEKKQKP